MDWRATLDTSNVVGPAEDAARALGSMRGALSGTGSALGALRGGDALAQVARGADSTAAAYKRSGDAAAALRAKMGGIVGAPTVGFTRPPQPTTPGQEPAKPGGNKGGGKKDGDAAEGAGRSAGKASGLFKDAAGGVGKLTGALKGALPLMIAATGAAGFAGLAKIAIGYKAISQIQGILSRAQLGFRQLFSGVNPQPLVRALDLFSRNFTAQTATGRAMGDAMTRAFNGIFRAVEAAEPYVTAFGQGILLAFLYAENAVLRARVALAPYTGALDGVVSSTTLLRVAALGGGIALVAAAGYAAVAAAPFLAMAAAILAVAAAFEQATKLAKEWDENSSSQIWRQLKSDLGIMSTEERNKASGIVTGDDYDRMQADKAKASGQAVGQAMGAGVVAGMAGAEAAVKAGGEKLAAAAEAGAKAKAEIRSPSRKMRRDVGRQLGEGVALGEEDMRGRVQRAAASSLVPDAPIAGGAVARGGGVSLTGPLVHVGQIVVGAMGDLGAEVRRILDVEAGRAAERLGIALPARA